MKKRNKKIFSYVTDKEYEISENKRKQRKIYDKVYNLALKNKFFEIYNEIDITSNIEYNTNEMNELNIYFYINNLTKERNERYIIRFSKKKIELYLHRVELLLLFEYNINEIDDDFGYDEYILERILLKIYILEGYKDGILK